MLGESSPGDFYRAADRFLYPDSLVTLSPSLDALASLSSMVAVPCYKSAQVPRRVNHGQQEASSKSQDAIKLATFVSKIGYDFLFMVKESCQLSDDLTIV